SLRTTLRTGVRAFAVDRHRRSNHDLRDILSTRDDLFQQDGSAQRVRADVALHFIHRLSYANLRCLVKDNAHAVESFLNEGAIADVAAEKLSFWIEKFGRVTHVHLRHQRVENTHMMTL